MSNVLTKLHQAPSPMLRVLVAALLLVLTFAGGYAVAAAKTVTLNVDGSPITAATMKSRVIDIVEENGFDVAERDDLFPAGDTVVHDADTITLRRSRPLQISLDGDHDTTQVWTTASTVDGALAQLSMTDNAPAAAPAAAVSRWRGWRYRWSAPRPCTSTTAARSRRCTWPRRMSRACWPPPAPRWNRKTG